jgi:CheY-like chemotaxis protein
MDGQLPDGTGKEAVSKIRRFESSIIFYKLTSFLVQNSVNFCSIMSLSGDAVPEQKKIYADLSVEEYLQKPFDKAQLLSIVLQYTSLHR